ncbi:MAG: UDP-glucose/GDP-mannose dehydrogenase family protein [Deltaproteobacteria bacterium]|nr:UDP-glucose/GDP-mannose dehydrogenase family protein [Deltaproteobacteria bacterium]
MNICVVGVGYVGLVTGTCFAEFGMDVTCVDKDQERIDALVSGHVPFYEPGLQELVTKNVNDGRLFFTADLSKAVADALIIFIAVGTPADNQGKADLQYVREVAAAIGQHINGYKIIVNKSTVPVGTAELVKQIIKENQSHPYPFDVASNPEFLREGSAIEDFMRPNRVVIGTDSEQAKAVLKDLYRPLYLIEAPFVLTNVQTAEMIKYASNAFLAMKISFINEMANLCELLDVDVHEVAKGMGLDNRIGRKFLHPGPGFGGSCFPKDTLALASLAEEKGYDFKLVNATIRVNEQQRRVMVDKIDHALNGLTGRTIGMLGLTFKPNTDDIRDSPPIYIIQGLLARGAKIQAYDPAGMEHARRMLPEVKYCSNPYEAADQTDGLVIATEWNQFRNIRWDRIKSLLKSPIVIDLRNVCDPTQMREKGFIYVGVGR